MRRFVTSFTTATLLLSALAISPASIAQLKQVIAKVSFSEFGKAKPVTFRNGVQNIKAIAQIKSVSCFSAGNCTAVGNFRNADGDTEAFSQTQTNGKWANAIPVTFKTLVQSIHPEDELYSVSCSSAGNCVAVGKFKNAAGDNEAFTQTQTNGKWATAIPAKFGALVRPTNPNDLLLSVSCPSAGNCVAAGSYADINFDRQGFTQTQSNGNWAAAKSIKFEPDAKYHSQISSLESVSCSSAGNCVAVGVSGFIDGGEAITQTLTNGTWATAKPAKFNRGVQSVIPGGGFNSVSCASAGNCVAVGRFRNADADTEAFTQTQTNGIWATAKPATFNPRIQSSSPDASFNSVSCSSAGNCVAVGHFKNTFENTEAFTQTQTNGIWATAKLAKFARGVQYFQPFTTFSSVSCFSTGNCVAAGYVRITDSYYEAFTQTQTNGIWATAKPATFNPRIQSSSPDASFNSVSCSSAGYCAAAGYFTNIAGHSEAFTSNAKWTKNVKAKVSVKPTVSGPFEVSKTLTANKGTWSGSPTPTFTYQWYACSKKVASARATVPSNCKKISGATKSALKLANAQKGRYISVVVTGKSKGTTATQWLSKSTAKVK